MKQLITVTKQELSKVENNLLNESQLNFLLKKTPQIHIYQRPAKGGGKWDFVTGTYMKKVLNMMFGWDWDFEVIQFEYTNDQALVLGKLSCRVDGRQIVKMQFGRADIKHKKGTNDPLDLGNDLKAATTDSLKKCASELGVASDIYGKNEFKEIKVVSSDGSADVWQLDRIHQLLDDVNLDDMAVRQIQMQLKDISKTDAFELIKQLEGLLPSDIDSGKNYTQTDINKKLDLMDEKS